MITGNRVKIAIAGMGSRGLHTYAKIIKDRNMADIAAVADPNPERIEAAKRLLDLPDSLCFPTLEKMLESAPSTDAVIIATQDEYHHSHAIGAMEAGYDILLEKPIAVSLSETENIAAVAKRLNRRVAVCHVLRYAPFYQEAKKVLLEGQIGEPVHISAFEDVGYWHQAHSFVRGNWANSKKSAFMLLAKCCHDLDIISWLMDRPAINVSSYGELTLFREENAPAGSTARCLDGCTVQKSCVFDCEDFYLYGERGLAHNQGWPVDTLTETFTEESVRNALANGPYGRCVYRCDNDVVDHQTVNILFDRGATASLTMSGLTCHGRRELRIMGTKGEIYGNLEENELFIEPFGEKPRKIITNADESPFSGHGGGDERLVLDFIHYIMGLPYNNISMTSIDTSLQSHYIAFAAEKSRLQNAGEPIHYTK